MVPTNASPAIDKGDPSFTSPPVGDQRMLPYKRVFNGRIDMGAVEVQPPPPTPDFNHDGVADLVDIDALVVEIAAGGNTQSFDLTGDGWVNREDLFKWLDDAPDVNGLAITRYLVGDANLDTVVDISDFNQWNNHKFTFAPAWSKGDFNADGIIDITDFNLWNNHKFTASPLPTGCGLSGRTVSDRPLAGGDRANEPIWDQKREHGAALISRQAEPPQPLPYRPSQCDAAHATHPRLAQPLVPRSLRGGNRRRE